MFNIIFKLMFVEKAHVLNTIC